MPSPPRPKSGSDGVPGSLSRSARDLRAKLVSEYGITDTSALTLLAVAVQAWDRARNAQKRLAVEGLTIKGRSGFMRPHPLVAVARDAESTFTRIMRGLNLIRVVPPKKPGRPALVHSATTLPKLGVAYVDEKKSN